MQHGEERVYLGLKLKKKSQSFMAKNHGNGQHSSIQFQTEMKNMLLETCKRISLVKK